MLKKDDRSKQMVYYQVRSRRVLINPVIQHDVLIGRYWNIHFAPSRNSPGSQDFEGEIEQK